MFFNNLEEVVKINSVEAGAFVMSVLETTEGCDCINHKKYERVLAIVIQSDKSGIRHTHTHNLMTFFGRATDQKPTL